MDKKKENAAYYKANREAINARHRQWYAEHRDEQLEKRREKYRNGTYQPTPYDSDIRHKYYKNINPDAKRVPRLSDDEKATIVSMFDSGYSLTCISKVTGRSFIGVRKFLRREGRLPMPEGTK